LTPYPSVASLVRQMEDPNRGQDALSEFYNSDVLFGFAIGRRQIFGSKWRGEYSNKAKIGS